MIRLRTFFFIALGVVGLWFLYLEKDILTPFVLAAIFAYIFNPVVNFFSHKIKLPRTLSIFIIYFFIIGIVILSGVILTRRVIAESSDLKEYLANFISSLQEQIDQLPDFLRPTADDTLLSLGKSKIFSPVSLFSLFPAAISRIVSFLIFLFSGFYFLKEGKSLIDRSTTLFPVDYKEEVENLLKKINAVLGGYLRGQLFLVFLVSGVLFILLSILGVRFALIVGVFSGFAEVVPLFGPILATAVAAVVVLVTGTINFSLTPFQGALAVIVVYFLVRQIQDYFITPFVMGKVTKMHPFVIFFAVLSGGHLFGILGFILAVPVAAIIKILLEFSLNKINKT